MNGYELYNPESVVMCLEDGHFEGYWSKTSSYQVISDRLKHNYKGIKDDVVRMLGQDISVGRKVLRIRSFDDLSNGFIPRLHLLKVDYPMNDESTLRDAGCFFE